MVKSIRDYVRIIDIFGIDFNFTIFKKDKFNTFIGGLMTLSCIIFFLVLFIYFSQDLFNKTNPTVTINTYNTPEYPFIKVNNSNFPIAWRFENEFKQPVDLNGYVYVQWELVRTLRNASTGIFSPIGSHYFHNTPCESISLNNDYLSSALKGWNCLDFSNIGDLTIGGFYGGDNRVINYLKGRAFYCQWNYVTNTYSNCTDYTKLNSLLNAKTKMYFSIYIPTLNLDPTNQVSPVSVDVFNVFSTLAPLLMKTDRFFYKTVNVSQDVGWFFQYFKNYTSYDLIRRDQDIQVRTIDDYNNPNLIKTLMTTIVYIDKQISNYQATFIKLQTVIANVGGVFKIFTMAIAFVLYFVHFKHRLDALINYLFEFDKNMKEINIKEKISVKFDSQSQDKDDQGSQIKKKFDRRTSRNSKSPHKISEDPTPPNIENNENDRKSRIGSPNSVFKMNKELLSPGQKKIKFELKQCTVLDENIDEIKPDLTKSRKTLQPLKFKYDINFNNKDFVTIWMLIKNFCCKNKVTVEESNSILLYNITSKILKKKSDIIYYFKLIDQFSIFKEIFLDSHQSKALNYISKQSVHFQYDSTKIELKEINDIIEYYRDKVKNNLINEADIKILQGIERRIIEEILVQNP